MRAQVREQDTVPSGELVEHAVPEVVMQWKRMQQHHIWTRTRDLVNELCVTAAEGCHCELPPYPVIFFAVASQVAIFLLKYA